MVAAVPPCGSSTGRRPARRPGTVWWSIGTAAAIRNGPNEARRAVRCRRRPRWSERQAVLCAPWLDGRPARPAGRPALPAGPMRPGRRRREVPRTAMGSAAKGIPLAAHRRAAKARPKSPRGTSQVASPSRSQARVWRSARLASAVTGRIECRLGRGIRHRAPRGEWTHHHPVTGGTPSRRSRQWWRPEG